MKSHTRHRLIAVVAVATCLAIGLIHFAIATSLRHPIESVEHLIHWSGLFLPFLAAFIALCFDGTLRALGIPLMVFALFYIPIGRATIWSYEKQGEERFDDGSYVVVYRKDDSDKPVYIYIETPIVLGVRWSEYRRGARHAKRLESFSTAPDSCVFVHFSGWQDRTYTVCPD